MPRGISTVTKSIVAPHGDEGLHACRCCCVSSGGRRRQRPGRSPFSLSRNALVLGERGDQRDLRCRGPRPTQVEIQDDSGHVLGTPKTLTNKDSGKSNNTRGKSMSRGSICRASPGRRSTLCSMPSATPRRPRCSGWMTCQSRLDPETQIRSRARDGRVRVHLIGHWRVT
jgi:hypothetical protein